MTHGRSNSVRNFNLSFLKCIVCRDLHSFPTRRSSDLELSLTLRGNPNAPGDRYDLAVTSDNRLRIRRWRNGSATVLGAVSTGLPWLPEWESFSFTVSGNAPVVLTATLNGTTRLTVTDG